MVRRTPASIAIAIAIGAGSLLSCGDEVRPPAGARSVSLVDAIATERATAEYDETRFRSVFKDGLLSRQVTFGARTEQAVTLPVPSLVRFRVVIPDDPVLRLSFGLSTLGDDALRAPATFSIRVNANGEARAVLEKAFPIRQPEPTTNRWWDGAVDLSAWAGEEVELVLESRWDVDRPVRQAAVAVWGDPVLSDRGARPSRPNLILISVDCLRADHVSAYGYERETTPHIDAVARDGELFEKAFTTAPWTLPSHMSMLTGELPSIHGATKWEKLDGSVPYLPGILSGAGYRAAGVVSWVYLSQAYGFERGFDVYEVLPDPEASDIVDRALAELDRGAGRSQFLFVHLYDAHWPYLPPPDLMERFGPRPADLSDLLRRVAEGEPASEDLSVEETIRLYDGEIAFADRELGRLFEALKERGLYSDALIIITADHGEAFLEHGHWEHSETLYDEVIRVPLIVKWPGEERTGRRDELASVTDIFATLVDVGTEGAHPSSDWAYSLDALPADRTIVSELETRFPGGSSLTVALRTARLKYIAALEAGEGQDLLATANLTSERLFDLVEDPLESTAMEAQGDARVERFRGELEAFLDAARRARAGRVGEKVELDPETLDRLESLGYVHSRE